MKFAGNRCESYMKGRKPARMLTTGMHSFPRIVADKSKKYVDKTALLHELASDRTDSQYFISRPRRFGKSLMLSTLRAMFECRRGLFEGLALDSLDWEWDKPYPVINITMASAKATKYEDFQSSLRGMVRVMAREQGLEFDEGETAARNFELLVQHMAKKSERGQVVVLIDEYDEPVAAFLDDLPTLEKVRAELHDFYEKLKINADYIRFLMITGVTKFTKLSVFSGLNHLTDLSMSPRFATLLGYTPEELDGALRENVEAFGEMNGIGFEAAKARLLEWYDGYRFSPQSKAKVCNPVSIGCAFREGVLRNYWESTGQTSMIVKRIRNADKIPADLEGMAATMTQLDVCPAESMPLPALLFQGGYLTIKDVLDPTTFRMGIPNNEIANSMAEGYVSSVLGNASIEDWTEQLAETKSAMLERGVESLLRRNLRAAFAAVPHEWRIDSEREAKRYFLLFLRLCGADISGERQSAMGRADAVLKDKSGVYVFEFKYGKTAAEAVEQARAKDYAGPWIDDSLPVFFVGINYNPERRGIDEPVVVPADK